MIDLDVSLPGCLHVESILYINFVFFFHLSNCEQFAILLETLYTSF